MISLPPRYGHLIRVLHSCTDQKITGALADMELTAAQGPILGFIECAHQPPCARDIEEAFRLTHPTVSGILSRLEKKGFIEFFPDETDRRCKRLRLLPRGEECLAIMRKTIDRNEIQLVEGFTEEEKDLFFNFLNRAIANMGGDPHKCRHKEEPNP